MTAIEVCFILAFGALCLVAFVTSVVILALFWQVLTG